LHQDLTTRSERTQSPPRPAKPELTIVIPCLNEAETLGVCIEKAHRFFRAYDVRGEVIVADNGSTDGSQGIARDAGARVVAVAYRGYGAALQAGIAAAETPYVAMADGDDSYDFMGLMPFVEKLREGYDLVMGNRFLGGIGRGAMPKLHRWVGNPVLSAAGRLLYGAPVGDFHCGMRAFQRTAILDLGLSSSGMEYASEMVVKAHLEGLRITEVPTTLSPDGRSRAPHLRSFRDGWRHLKFLLLFAPKWLFLYPGLAVFLAGLASMLALLPGTVTLGDLRLGVNSLLFSGTAMLLGLQIVCFGLLAELFGSRERYWLETDRVRRIRHWLTVDRACIAGGGLFLLGLGGSAYAALLWQGQDFGDMVTDSLMRVTIPSVLACAMGLQIAFTGFLAELIGHPRRGITS
jgi:glycosyltransferase involved in cell wall biosynthesis